MMVSLCLNGAATMLAGGSPTPTVSPDGLGRYKAQLGTVCVGIFGSWAEAHAARCSDKLLWRILYALGCCVMRARERSTSLEAMLEA